MITALVLAAGLSKRMGEPKMILPWRNSTVIGTVVSTIHAAGIDKVWVVTGGARNQVEAALEGLRAHVVFNPDYANGEMLHSVQVGLEAIPSDVEAVLLALGDQPQIRQDTVEAVIAEYRHSQAKLILPSYNMRRGHPWLIHRSLWDEIVALRLPETLRDFINRHAGDIQYLILDTPTILQDLDTPEDYRQHNKA